MLPVDIQYPIIHIRQPPWFKVAKLLKIHEKNVTTVRESMDSFAPSNKYRDRREGRPIGRVISLHHGYLPSGFENEVHGACDPAQKKSWTENGSQSWYKRLQSDMMTELYGSKSFLQNYIRGESSYDACEVAITNWQLEARICAFRPANETAAARTQRLQNIVDLNRAIETLQNRVKNAYAKAYAEAAEKIWDDATPSDDRARLSEGSSLYAVLKDTTIEPAYNDTVPFATIEEVKNAMYLHLYGREEEERCDFWKSRINGDVLATMFRQSRSFIDLRTFIESPTYYKMWTKRLEATCDAMYQYIIARKNLEDRIQFMTTDTGVHLVGFKLKDLKPKVNSVIQGMDDDFPEEEYGTWEDVPVLTTYGKVRDAEDASLDMPLRATNKRKRTSLIRDL